MARHSPLHSSSMKALNESLVSLPTPSNLTHFWSLGSMLGLVSGVQIGTGLILASSYSSEISSAFYSVIMLGTDSWYGWLVRSLHFNGASLFFIGLYLHIGRGVYFASYRKSFLWLSGSLLMLLVMAIAFLGYVLPWGQMSFWGATVITNLLSAIPIWGESLVSWIWGGFSVAGATLSRFFMLHFILPLAMLVFIFGHLLLLHTYGSSEPVGSSPCLDKVPFHPYFVYKDFTGFWAGLTFLLVLSLAGPWLLGEADNFIEANPLVTPAHIKPEWYFLFAYAVLRSVPNKLGGVLALLGSVLVVPLLTLFPCVGAGVSWSMVRKSMFWVWVSSWVLLTWGGGCPVEDPYILISSASSCVYFASWAFFGFL